MPEPEPPKKREFTRRDFFLAGALAVGTASAVGTYITPGGSSQSSVTIKYVTGADSSGAQGLLIDMWNQANPRAMVDPMVVGGESTFDQRQAMQSQMENGQADVVNMDVIHIPYFREEGLIVPVELENVPDFLQNTLLASQVGIPGTPSTTTPDETPTTTSEKPQYWAAPFNADVGMIFQRVTPNSPPGDVPTLVDLVDRIVPDRSGQFVQQLQRAGRRSREALVVNVLEHALSRDPEILDATTGMPLPALDRWQSALRPLRAALTKNRIVATDTEDSSAAVFRQRRISYMRNWPVRYRDLQLAGDGDSLSGKVRLGPLPNGVLGGGSLAIAANAPHAGRAEEFVRFLTGVPAQKILAQLAVAPTRTAAYDEGFRTFVPHLIRVRDAVESARPRPVSAAYQAFSDVAFGHFANFVGGADLPTTFVDDIKRALRI